MEQTLEPLLQEAFDALFTGPVRTDLQWHGERIIHAVLRGDFEAAGQHAEQALQSALHGTLTVLQRHLEQVVSVLLKVLLTALQEALGSLLKENLGTITAALPGGAEEKARRKVEETGAALRERTLEAKETM